MVETASEMGAEWLTPFEAVALLATRLHNPDDARAIMLILDHASEGQITSRARRLVLATPDKSDVYSDHNLPADLWQAIKVGSTYSCFETGDFDALVHRSGIGWLTITARGVRLLAPEIEAIIPERRSAPGEQAHDTGGMEPVYAPPRTAATDREWDAWVNKFRLDHDPLPDVDRVIVPAARAHFGKRITQTRVRKTFGGLKPGPRVG